MRQRLIPELGSAHQTKQLFIQAQSTLQAWLFCTHWGEISSLPAHTIPAGVLGHAEPTLVLWQCREWAQGSSLLPSCATSSCWGCRDQLCTGGQELPAELEEKPYDLYRPFRGLCALWREGFYFQQNLGWVLSLFLAKLVSAIRLMCPWGYCKPRQCIWLWPEIITGQCGRDISYYQWHFPFSYVHFLGYINVTSACT